MKVVVRAKRAQLLVEVISLVVEDVYMQAIKNIS